MNNSGEDPQPRSAQSGQDRAGDDRAGEARSSSRYGAGPDRAPEVEQLLDRSIKMLEDAPGIPMSASVRVNRDELLEVLDEALARLPSEMREARWLLKEREEFRAKTRRDAEEMIAQARSQVAHMMQRSEVVKAAEHQAESIMEDAEAQARRMRRETEDYCDQRLASFENVLAKVQQSVGAARQRLAAPSLEESELGSQDDSTGPQGGR
jgi:hypothetical protein